MISCAAQVNLRESALGLGQIEISCYSSATLNNNHGIKFSIVAMDRATNDTVSTSELVSCTPNTNTRLEIANLSCSKCIQCMLSFLFPTDLILGVNYQILLLSTLEFVQHLQMSQHGVSLIYS